MSLIPVECVDQYACLAANINFNLENLRNGFWQLTIDGLSWGAIYALVAVGYTLVFGVLRLINFAHSEIFMLGMFGAYFALDIIMGFTPSGNAYNKGIVLTVLYLGIAMLFAMLVSGPAAVGLEFVAYRPLRRRNARSLTFLITAIGMSFVLQEFVHFVLPKLLKGYGGSNAQQPIILVQPKTQFTIFGALGLQRHDRDHRGGVDLRGAHRLRDQPDEVRSRDPRRRTGSDHRDVDGCLTRTHHHDDVLDRRPARRRRCPAVHAEGAAGDHLLRRIPVGYQGILRRGARRHRQSSRRAARRPAARASWRTTARRCSAPSGAT